MEGVGGLWDRVEACLLSGRETEVEGHVMDTGMHGEGAVPKSASCGVGVEAEDVERKVAFDWGAARHALCIAILGWVALKGRVPSRRCLPLSAPVTPLDNRIPPGFRGPEAPKGLRNESATARVGLTHRPRPRPPQGSRSPALATPAARRPARVPSEARSPQAPAPPSSRGSPRGSRWRTGRSNLSTNPSPCPDACPLRGVAVMRWREVLQGGKGSTASVSWPTVFRFRDCLRGLAGRLGGLVGRGVFPAQAARGAARGDVSSCGRMRRSPLPLRRPHPYPRPS